jgi:hypothetical protein
MRLGKPAVGVVCLALCLASAATAQNVNVKRSMPPVGAIIGFVLTPAEAAKLAPEWLPADGKTVTDGKSPLNGRALPDMNGLVLRGVPPTQDASSDAGNLGGSTAALSIAGQTNEGGYTNCSGGFSPQPTAGAPFQNKGFVIDTPNPEVACNHTHGFSATAPAPVPPYRGVIFLVRVR